MATAVYFMWALVVFAVGILIGFFVGAIVIKKLVSDPTWKLYCMAKKAYMDELERHKDTLDRSRKFGDDVVAVSREIDSRNKEIKDGIDNLLYELYFSSVLGQHRSHLYVRIAEILNECGLYGEKGNPESIADKKEILERLGREYEDKYVSQDKPGEVQLLN